MTEVVKVAKSSKKLRSRISLAFLLIFVFSQLCVMGIFYLIESERQKRSGQRIVKSFKVLLHEVVRFYVPSRKYLNDKARLAQLRKMLIHLKSVNKFAKLWLADGKGDVVVQSFPGPLPSYPMKVLVKMSEVVIRRGASQDGYRYVLMEMPVVLKDGTKVFLKIYARSMFKLQAQDIVFLLGVLGLTLAIGPITFFVSRIITKPLKDLTYTAHQVSEGNLSVRAKTGVPDEICELATVFNSMLDFIERLLRGTKELTANISHELRTPLTRVLISRELLEDHLDNYKREVFAKHLAYIQQDVERMNDMISRILLLSRLDIQPGMEQHSLLDVSELLYELIASFDSVKQSSRFHLRASVGPDLVVMAQEDEFGTAISNLIDNAIKYSPEGTEIQVEASRIDTNITIVVTNELFNSVDSVVDVERLFEPFYRPKEEKTSGSGLGLAIVRKIVENAGGTVSLECQDNKFMAQIILPAADNG